MIQVKPIHAQNNLSIILEYGEFNSYKNTEENDFIILSVSIPSLILRSPLWFCNFPQSKRSRKAVNYANDGLGTDDEDKSKDQGNQSCDNQETVEHELPQDRSLCGDATADFGGKNRRKAEDSSPGKDLCRDYTEMEGAMCMDEIEIGQLDSRHDDPTSVDQFSEDYLKMGGGFCVEEDEKDQDHNGCSAKEGTDLEAELDAQPAQSISSLQKSADGFQSNAELNLEPPCPKTGLSRPESPGDDTAAKTVKALRAMPFLRKKRKLG